MSLASRFAPLALALCPWFAACGSKTPDAPPAKSPAADESQPRNEKLKELDNDTASAAEHIARLIPTSTAIYVQLKSFAQLDALVARLSRSNDSLGRRLEELRRAVHHMVPGDERQIMNEQPAGIAITLPLDGDPQFTFVLPLRDVTAYKRSLALSPRAPQPLFDGAYLAVSTNGVYEKSREPVAIAMGLEDRPISARLDLARIDRRYGSQIRLALASLAARAEGEQPVFLPHDPELSGWLEEVAEPLLYALAVGRQMELSADTEADRVQVECALETRDAGVLAGWTASEPIDLAPYARSLVASDTLAMLGGCERDVMAERIAALLSDDESEREHVSRLLESFADQFGSIGAFTGSLTPGESHFSLHVRATDDPAFARNLAATLELFSRSGLGVAVQSKSLATVEGVEIEDLLVHFDAASTCVLTGEKADDLSNVQARLDAVARSLFGAEAVHVRITALEGRGLITIGNDEAWFRRTLLWAKEDKDLTPPEVRAALGHLGPARAAAIVRIDLARWAQDSQEWRAQWHALSHPVRSALQPTDPPNEALDPLPLTLHLGAEGRTLRIGLSLGLRAEPKTSKLRR